MKSIYVSLFIGFLLLIPFHAFSQARFPGSQGDGQELGFSLEMNGIALTSISVDPGLSLEDFLYLGLDWDLGWSEIGGEPAQEVKLGLLCRGLLLEQKDAIPLNVRISGSFQKITFISDYLDTNDLKKSGTGFSVTTEIFRSLQLSKRFAMQFGVVGRYRSYSYVTEPDTGTTDPTLKTFEDTMDYLYGFQGGFSVAFTKNFLLFFNIDLAVNQDYEFIYGPTLGIVSVQIPWPEEETEDRDNGLTEHF